MYSKEQLFDAFYPVLKQYTDTKEQAVEIIADLFSILQKARRAVNASQYTTDARKTLDANDERNVILQEFYKNKQHTGKYFGFLPYGVPDTMVGNLYNEPFDDPSRVFFNTPLTGLGLRKKSKGRPYKIHKTKMTKAELVDILHEHGLKGNMSMKKDELERIFKENVKGGNILTSGIFKEFGDFGSKLIDEYPKKGLKYALEHPDDVAKLIAKLF